MTQDITAHTMVRLKQRYILFDIIYPPSFDTKTSEYKELLNFSNSPQTALLSLHKASPSTVDPKVLLLAIRRVVEDHYGEFGAGMAGASLIIKYFSNKTSTGIIRCNRQSLQMVIAALTLINKVGDRSVIIKCAHISGTIKKCEQYSIRRSREMMNLVSQTQNSNSDFDSIFSAFQNSEDMMNMKNDLKENEDSD